MPKKFEVRDFVHFEYLLCQRLGFKKITLDEFRKRLRQLNKKPPRPREGRETGFEFKTNKLTVIVWTTYLEDKGKFREKGADAGWVLIIQNGKKAHFSRPAPRTKNFLLNLYRRVWINWCRVLKRPRCPECNEYMDITKGRHLKQRFWCCDRRKLHKIKKRYTLGFNFALPPEAKRFKESEYKRRKKYNIQVKKAGKQPYAAMLGRREWTANEPKN